MFCVNGIVRLCQLLQGSRFPLNEYPRIPAPAPPSYFPSAPEIDPTGDLNVSSRGCRGSCIQVSPSDSALSFDIWGWEVSCAIPIINYSLLLEIIIIK
jgi:hypothetical protein